MGKTLIIKNADFSENKIDTEIIMEQIQLIQGLTNLQDADKLGCVEPTDTSFHTKRVRSFETVKIPQGKKVTFHCNNNQVAIRWISVYNEPFTCGLITVRDLSQHEKFIENIALTETYILADNYSWTNDKGIDIYVIPVFCNYGDSSQNISPSFEVGYTLK